jgi:hypothetical protein
MRPKVPPTPVNPLPPNPLPPPPPPDASPDASPAAEAADASGKLGAALPLPGGGGGFRLACRAAANSSPSGRALPLIKTTIIQDAEEKKQDKTGAYASKEKGTAKQRDGLFSEYLFVFFLACRAHALRPALSLPEFEVLQARGVFASLHGLPLASGAVRARHARRRRPRLHLRGGA